MLPLILNYCHHGPDELVDGYAVRTGLVLESQRRLGFLPRVTRPPAPGAPLAGEDPYLPRCRTPAWHRWATAACHLTRSFALILRVDLGMLAQYLAGVVARQHPRLLLATTPWPLGRTAAGVARRFSLPFVYEVRSLPEESMVAEHRLTPGDDYYHYARTREIAAMQAADRVVTLSEAMKDDFVSRGVPAGRIKVVPNGMVPTPLPDPGARRAFRARWQLGEGPVAGYISSAFRSLEGVETLIRAWPAVEAALPRARLVLAGKETPEQRALAEQLGIASGIVFTGTIPHDRIGEAYDALDLFVIPRTHDRICRLVTPLKPVEAMSHGLPLVASRLPALAELGEEGRTGWLVPPEDPPALAAALLSALSDPDRLRAMGRAARAWVMAHRDWEKLSAAYGEIFSELLAIYAPSERVPPPRR